VTPGIADNNSLRELLDALATGHTGVEETIQKLRLFQISQLGDFARLDSNRILRKGVPEVIYAPRKTEKNLAAIVEHFLDARGLALVSRLEPERADLLRGTLEASGRFEHLEFDYEQEAGVLAVTTDTYRPPETRGYVGLLTAGTSDIPVAEEAALVAKRAVHAVIQPHPGGISPNSRLPAIR